MFYYNFSTVFALLENILNSSVRHSLEPDKNLIMTLFFLNILASWFPSRNVEEIPNEFLTFFFIV